jgi:hypothetical protein
MSSLALIVLCVVLRVLPHPPNFAPVGATAVFAGRTLPLPAALLLTLVASLVADAALAAVHGYPFLTWVTPFVYAAFFVQAALGRALRRRRGGAIGAAVLGALAFFVITNVGVWALGGYGYSLAGLLACFTMALPFLAGTLAGDVMWTLVLGLAYRALASRRSTEAARAAELPLV